MAWRRSGVAGVTTAMALLAAPVVVADDFNLITARGSLSLGSFLNASNLKIRVNQLESTDDLDPGFRNPFFDWSNTLGNPNVVRFRLDGLWRISNKHHLRFMWTDYSLTRSATLQKDVAWGSDVIEVGADVRGKHGFSVTEVAYEYAFRSDENLELALTAGLHYTTFLAQLTSEVSTPEGELTGTLGGKASVDVPLPVFGGRALWRIGGDFYLDAMAQWFALSIQGYSGSLVNYRGSVTWQPQQWLGIGLSYDYFGTNLDVRKRDFNGSVDWSYSGPQLFLNIGF